MSMKMNIGLSALLVMGCTGNAEIESLSDTETEDVASVQKNESEKTESQVLEAEQERESKRFEVDGATIVTTVAPEESVSSLDDQNQMGALEKKEEGKSNRQQKDIQSQSAVQEKSGKVDSRQVKDSTGLGGLMGAKGVQVGGAGLGTTGSGFGLGDLNITGVGRGTSGDGQGLMTFADAGEGRRAMVESEEYTDYGVNQFVLTSADVLSTFAIDVDTASYALARSKINDGQLPNYAGVRPEEFINAFDYQYQSPKSEPLVVDMDVMKHPFTEGHHILRVGLQAQELDVNRRPNVHLTFLVDVSGSMSSANKLPIAQESLHQLVDAMQESDSVSLVTYAGRSEVVLAPTSIEDRKSIHAAIDRLNSGGSTAMSSGLDLAYEMAWRTFEVGAENRVVVLSDGDANVGNTSWESMLKQIKGYADRGVTLSTVGFGMGNYKDSTMEQLANKGDGNHFYIDSLKEAHKVFVEGFNGSMIGLARDVKLQVEFDPNVIESYRLIGYENRDVADSDFRNDRVDAGEIGYGHSVTALYELVLQDFVVDSSSGVTAHLRYEKAGPDSIATERQWHLSTQELRQAHLGSRSTQQAFAVATFAEILHRSPYASHINLKDVLTYGQQIAAKDVAEFKEFLSLIQSTQSIQDSTLVSHSVDF